MEVEGGEGLKAVITNYFFNYFTPMAGTDLTHILATVRTHVSAQMNAHLLADFKEEVWAVLESIGDLKAPRPDGMSAIFYKKY